MSLEIRAAGDADLPAVLNLHAELEKDHQLLSMEQAQTIFKAMKRYPDYTLYVATWDGVIVGTFTLLIMDGLAHLGSPSGIVEDVVVHANWRGRGIGKRMMQFAMKRCRARGCYKLALSSHRKREAAHRFYESLGFQKHGYSFIIELKESNNV
jgi:GNAT superfamily N-acetyltransferase